MIVAVLQARYSSRRLPGKVMEQVWGRPMLARQIERVRRARSIDRLIVATSVDPSDDKLAELCASIGVECYRGSLDDVLDRFYHAAHPAHPDYVVRLTGDCPLADPALIDSIVRFCRDREDDYSTNAVEPTYPDGLDVEVMRFSALETAWKEATVPSQREHVTLFINRQADRFRLGHFKGPVDLSFLRWTVDEPEDLRLVREIYAELYPRNAAFTTDDVLQLLERRPELKSLNLKYERNEGLKISYAKEKGSK